jgi:uncharacterized lipoprotein
MKMRRNIVPVIVLLSLLGLSGCESMNNVRQSFEDLNKLLTPLAVLKKGNGS